MLGHIRSICSLVEKYTDVITAVECGMVGPWGEMHTTYYATAEKNGIKYGYIVAIMQEFLDGLSKCKIPLLVRQPAFLKAYISAKGNNEKLGLYNDGYLGSGSDLGTFKSDNRAAEIEYLSPFTAKTPYGGELCFDDVDEKYGMWRESRLAGTVKEMYNVHLSFLNIAWNNHVLKWADSADSYYRYDYTDDNGVAQFIEITDSNLVDIGNGTKEKFFQYLIKHMGYRYVVTDSQIGMNNEKNTAGFKLSFKNNGFANIPYHRNKIMSVIFVKDGENVLEKSISNMTFNKIETDFSEGFSRDFSVDISSLPAGQ